MALSLFLLQVNTANSLSKQIVFPDRLNPLDAYNDTEFISRYRITRGIFIQLLEKIVGSLFRYTVRVAYYEPAYYEHLFIMNQAEGPNGYILIAFVLNKVRLI